jgi:hypothetical protein
MVSEGPECQRKRKHVAADEEPDDAIRPLGCLLSPTARNVQRDASDRDRFPLNELAMSVKNVEGAELRLKLEAGQIPVLQVLKAKREKTMPREAEYESAETDTNDEEPFAVYQEGYRGQDEAVGQEHGLEPGPPVVCLSDDQLDGGVICPQEGCRRIGRHVPSFTMGISRRAAL